MTTSISAQKHCHQCNKTQDQITTGSIKNCARCKTVYYCSRGCQEKDWPVHKLGCKKVKEIGKNSNTTKEKNTNFQEKFFQAISSSKKSTTHSEQNQKKISDFLIDVHGVKLLNAEKFSKFRESFFKAKEFDFLINWLNKAITDVHYPLLYLELSKVLFLKAEKSQQSDEQDDLFAKSKVFRNIGLAFACADAQSITNDSSCASAPGAFSYTYPTKALSDSQNEKYRECLKEEVDYLLPLLDEFPSPKWLGPQGMNSYMGIPPEIKSADECKSAREKALKNLLEK